MNAPSLVMLAVTCLGIGSCTDRAMQPRSRSPEPRLASTTQRRDSAEQLEQATRAATQFVRLKLGGTYRLETTAVTPEGYEFTFTDEAYNGPGNWYTVRTDKSAKVVGHYGGL